MEIANIQNPLNVSYEERERWCEALPLEGQKAVERQAIANDPQVQERVKPSSIQTISLAEELKGGRVYRVETEDGRTIYVEVNYLPPPHGIVGPQLFEVQVLEVPFFNKDVHVLDK